MPELTAVKITKISRETAAWKRAFRAFYSDCDVKELAPEQPHAYFAAYSGSDLAGHCVVYLENGRWVMDGLMVKPEFRQAGVASRLTEARIRYAAGAGAKEIWYSCADGNLVTICCHVRYGFEKVCPARHHCDASTAHWYRLDVNPELFRKFPALRP